MKMSDIYRGGCGVRRFNVIRAHSPELPKAMQSESCSITVREVSTAQSRTTWSRHTPHCCADPPCS